MSALGRKRTLAYGQEWVEKRIRVRRFDCNCCGDEDLQEIHDLHLEAGCASRNCVSCFTLGRLCGGRRRAADEAARHPSHPEATAVRPSFHAPGPFGVHPAASPPHCSKLLEGNRRYPLGSLE